MCGAPARRALPLHAQRNPGQMAAAAGEGPCRHGDCGCCPWLAGLAQQLVLAEVYPQRKWGWERAPWVCVQANRPATWLSKSLPLPLQRRGPRAIAVSQVRIQSVLSPRTFTALIVEGILNVGGGLFKRIMESLLEG